MCPWVGPHAPSFGGQLWGLPSRVEYLSPQGVLLPLVYGTTASPLWLGGPLCLAGDPLLDCVPARLSPVASMAPGDVCHGPRCSLAGLGPVALEYRSCHWPGGSAGSPQCVRPMGCWFFPVPRPPYLCAVSWAAWPLFTGVPARFAVLRLRCPGPLGSCSPVCSLGVLCCVSGVLGHLAPGHRCARWVCCVACAVSRATWLLFTGAPARCVALRVRCPWPLGSCSPVCPLGVLCCVCGVLGHLAPVHRCACAVCCVVSAVSWVTWLLFTGVSPRVCLLLSPRSLPLPFPCSSLFACLFCFVVFFLGGWLGCGVFGAVRGCGCVPVPVLVWAWVSWGTGVGWLSRSGFPVCAPAPRVPVSRAPVWGVLTAGGWQLWWRGACVGGRGSWVAPGWRGRARARVSVC